MNVEVSPTPVALSWSPKSAALPVVFCGTTGLFTPPATGVEPLAGAALFLSPWGFEEMCTRKLWRELAERLAGAGIASLRFDYPGTGDALDGGDFSGALAIWEDAVAAAAARLRHLSGASGLILIGHGLGATLAATMAPRLEAVQAVAMMAPVVSGRLHLRELAAWSKMVDDGLGLRKDQRIADRVSVAGLVMPDEIAAQVKDLSIEDIPAAPARRILMVERPMRNKETALSARFEQLGAEVARLSYQGYDDLVSNPTLATQPAMVIERVVRWAAMVAAAAGGTVGRAALPGQPRLEGADFTEMPLRFGDEDRLYGVLCQPRGERRGATVIYLVTAYDRHAGWARSTVQTARYLASRGVASLRFDAANVGDSPAQPGMPDQVLFSERQIDDVRAALDLVDRLRLGPAVLAGRCSGAYLAFRSALLDDRCKAAVIVNPFTFVWDDEESVDDALRYTPRSLADYGRRATSAEILRRLATGQIDIPRVVINIAKQLARRAAARAPAFMAPLSKYGRLRQATHAAFKRLSDRNMPLSLIYSSTDVGLDRYHLYLGPEGEWLERCGNVSVEIVRDADHNMSPPEARAFIRERILASALQACPPGDDPSAPRN